MYLGRSFGFLKGPSINRIVMNVSYGNENLEKVQDMGATRLFCQLL